MFVERCTQLYTTGRKADVRPTRALRMCSQTPNDTLRPSDSSLMALSQLWVHVRPFALSFPVDCRLDRRLPAVSILTLGPREPRERSLQMASSPHQLCLIAVSVDSIDSNYDNLIKITKHLTSSLTLTKITNHMKVKIGIKCCKTASIAEMSQSSNSGTLDMLYELW